VITWIKAKWAMIKVIIISGSILAFFGLLYYIRYLKSQMEEAEGWAEINKRNELIRKAKQKMDTEKDKIHEAIVNSSRDVDKTKDPDDKGQIDFGKWCIIFCLFIFTSCAPRVIYEQVYIKPDIPKLMVIDDVELEPVSISPDESGLYCFTYEEISKLFRNEQKFKNLINFYKMQIQMYLGFYDSYYGRNE